MNTRTPAVHYEVYRNVHPSACHVSGNIDVLLEQHSVPRVHGAHDLELDAHSAKRVSDAATTTCTPGWRGSEHTLHRLYSGHVWHLTCCKGRSVYPL